MVVVPQRGLLLRAAAPLAGARGRPPLGGGPHRLSPAAGARVAAGGRDPGSHGARAAATLRCRGQRGPALVAPGADADAAGGAGQGCQHHLHGALVGASSGTDRVARRRRRALPGAAGAGDPSRHPRARPGHHADRGCHPAGPVPGRGWTKTPCPLAAADCRALPLRLHPDGAVPIASHPGLHQSLGGSAQHRVSGDPIGGRARLWWSYRRGPWTQHSEIPMAALRAHGLHLCHRGGGDGSVRHQPRARALRALHLSGLPGGTQGARCLRVPARLRRHDLDRRPGPRQHRGRHRDAADDRDSAPVHQLWWLIARDHAAGGRHTDERFDPEREGGMDTACEY